MLMHACIHSTLDVEAGRRITGSRPAWATYRDPVLKRNRERGRRRKKEEKKRKRKEEEFSDHYKYVVSVRGKCYGFLACAWKVRSQDNKLAK